MNKFWAILISCVLFFTIAAAPAQTFSGTIVRITENPAYQQPVFFDTTVTSKLKGYQYPMVIVDCYQNGELVYRQLDHPDTAFILGGGSSLWVSRGGGPATCNGQLWIYNGLHSGGPFFVIRTENFEAAG